MLATEGAHVLTYARNQNDLRDALAEAENLGGQVHAVAADQASPADLQHVFEQAHQILGGVDILINNAALEAGSVLDNDFDQIQYVIQTNLAGYLLASKLALQRMISQGGGHIVNVGSMSAEVRESESDVYVATKTAVQAFSEALRKLVNEKNVKLSLIEPGRVGTDMQPTTPRQQRRQQNELQALTAEDIAESIYYCLAQPPRCDVISVQIRPHRQAI
jgi:NADP-dependent 3-hydroxy acid dehydrogenase YdfG